MKSHPQSPTTGWFRTRTAVPKALTITLGTALLALGQSACREQSPNTGKRSNARRLV